MRGPKRNVTRISLRFIRATLALANLPSGTYNFKTTTEHLTMKVSTSEFIKNYSALADKAQSEPVVITENDRDRLVVLSAEEYARLKRRDRRVVKLEDFTEAEMALIAQAEPSPDDVHLDRELKDWRA